MENPDLQILREAMEKLSAGFATLPAAPSFNPDHAAEQKILLEVAERLHDNYPFFHPLYAGQMLKPPHRVAWLAYALAMLLNPNNHALEGGKASSEMEIEAVRALASMFGFSSHLGHLTGGGTMANLEALWIAGSLHPGSVIVASSQAHYTHQRICAVLGLEFEPIPCDRFGRMDLNALRRRLDQGNVGTVVATIGTTAIGSVDPLPDLLELRRSYDFRLHADAAYGGYFILADNLDAQARNAYEVLREVDSIVIDPHKHGLQPYGCGCVIFRDPAVGRFYKHDSPYTYFGSAELHLGEISLECSRPGAQAVSLWATQKLFPLVRDGEFGNRLSHSRAAALELYSRLQSDSRFLTAFKPELDIVIWTVRARKVSEASELAQLIFKEAERRQLYLALATLPCDFFDLESAGMVRDQDSVVCLRSVLMKPEHSDWVERILQILDSATAAVFTHNPRLCHVPDPHLNL